MLTRCELTQDIEERWFVAVLVFESVLAKGDNSDSSVDVQFRLIRAVDAESAYQRALALGRRDEHSYATDQGDTCTWRFAGLQDLNVIEDAELGHGTELYGLIEDGRAADRVVEKRDLTAFLE